MIQTIGAVLAGAKGRWDRLSATWKWRVALGTAACAAAVYLACAGIPDRPDVPDGDRWKIRDIVAFHAWWGAVGSVAFLACLAAICPWWAGRRVEPGPRRSAPRPAACRWAVLGAVALSAWTAWPRMDQSLWDDEEHTVRRYVVGSFEREEKGEVARLKTVPWLRTFYDYRKPNNHIPLSALARVCHEVWRKWNPGDPRPFSETAMRLPALAFGLGAIMLVGWLGRILGSAWAGAGAAWLVALHPWHLRYATELRGYSMAMFFALLALGLWVLAVRGGRWRAWLGCFLAQGLCLYTYPGTLFVFVCLNAFTPFAIMWSRGAARPALPAAGRWFCSGAFLAAAMLPVMLPLVPQVKLYLQTPEAVGANRIPNWYGNTGASFVGGVPWVVGNGKRYPQMSHAAAHSPALFWGVAGGLALALACGCAALAHRSPESAGVVCAVAGGIGATLAYAVVKDQYLHIWYLVHLLPALALIVAFGVRWWLTPVKTPWVAAFAAAGALALFASATHEPRLRYRGWPITPLRDSAHAVAQMLAPRNPDAPEPLLVGIGMAPVLYEPRMIVPRNAGHLLNLMARADRDGRPLVVNLGHFPYEQLTGPTKLRLIQTRRLFREWFRMDGFDPPLDKRIYRYRPGSLAGYDASWVNREAQ